MRFVALLAALATAPLAQDWPRFRGPDGAGHGEVELPAAFDAGAALWRVELPGRGHSSPVVLGERAYVTCEIAETNKRAIVCVSTDDGALLWIWDTPYEPFRQHRMNSYAGSTVAVDTDGVYASWVSGEGLQAVALDHAGDPLWQVELGGFRAQHGPGASPVVCGDVVAIANDHEGEGSFLVGLDRRTGEVVWKHARESVRAAPVTPAVWREGERELLLYSSTAHGLTCLGPGDRRGGVGARRPVPGALLRLTRRRG